MADTAKEKLGAVYKNYMLGCGARDPSWPPAKCIPGPFIWRTSFGAGVVAGDFAMLNIVAVLAAASPLMDAAGAAAAMQPSQAQIKFPQPAGAAHAFKLHMQAIEVFCFVNIADDTAQNTADLWNFLSAGDIVAQKGEETLRMPLSEVLTVHVPEFSTQGVAAAGTAGWTGMSGGGPRVRKWYGGDVLLDFANADTLFLTFNGVASAALAANVYELQIRVDGFIYDDDVPVPWGATTLKRRASQTILPGLPTDLYS